MVSSPNKEDVPGWQGQSSLDVLRLDSGSPARSHTIAFSSVLSPARSEHSGCKQATSPCRGLEKDEILLAERSPIYKLSKLDSNTKSATSRMVDQHGNKMVNTDPVVAVHCLGLSTGGTSLLITASSKGNLVDSSDDDILVDTTLDNTVSDEVADQA